MIYAKANDEGHIIERKEIDQDKMTSECWEIQFSGIGACEECELKDTDECGGKGIRKSMKNSKGIDVPI